MFSGPHSDLSVLKWKGARREVKEAPRSAERRGPFLVRGSSDWGEVIDATYMKIYLPATASSSPVLMCCFSCVCFFFISLNDTFFA